jgi:hypothetical protein
MRFGDSRHFPLMMISAMYENGGNTVHRLLDGHPQLFVYPFESQLGTRLVHDEWTSLYPQKYRYPVFARDASARDDFFSIIDEETRVRSRTPWVSKFRDRRFELDDDERCERFVALVGDGPRSSSTNVCAFFEATFDSWKNHHSSGAERLFVGYSPVFGVDAEVFLEQLPNAHLVHVVRNPWSAYAETLRRPVPLSLKHYVHGWTVVQQLVLAAQDRFPDRVTIVRFEDVCNDAAAALRPVCSRLGITATDLLPYPSWNGERLEEIYPWGTIRVASLEANRETAAQLTAAQQHEVGRRARLMLAPLGYTAETGALLRV